MIYYLKPVFAAVTAEQLTRELAAAAVWWANAQPSERAGKEPPRLPRGVTYSEQGAFLLDVPGDGDIRVSVTDYVVRDHAGKPSTMAASEFERLYEAQNAALMAPDMDLNPEELALTHKTIARPSGFRAFMKDKAPVFEPGEPKPGTQAYEDALIAASRVALDPPNAAVITGIVADPIATAQTEPPAEPVATATTARSGSTKQGGKKGGSK